MRVSQAQKMSDLPIAWLSGELTCAAWKKLLPLNPQSGDGGRRLI